LCNADVIKFVDAKMVFTAEDKVLIKCLQESKNYGAVNVQFCQNLICWLGVMQMYLGFAYVTPYWQWGYFVINIQQLVTWLRNTFFSTKLGGHFNNLLGIKFSKLCSDSFRFDISIVQRLQSAVNDDQES